MRFWIAALSVAALLVSGEAAFAEKRVAFVVGNGAYKNVPALLRQYVFGKEADTPVLPAKHGDSSGVRGAAWLWPLE